MANILSAWLHITNACNLLCHYCYVGKTNEAMSLETGRRAVDALFRTAVTHRYDRVWIKYAGGEATLNFPMVVQLHDYALALAEWTGIDLKGAVFSNGVALSQSKIRDMLARDLALRISLDGLEAYNDAQRVFQNGKGSFVSVAHSIDRARVAGLIPHIGITVTNRSIKGLPGLVTWILEKELPFSINFYRENLHSASSADLKLEEQGIIEGMMATFQVIEKDLPRQSLLSSLVDKADLSFEHSQTCSVGESYLVIDHLGRVAKCHMEIEQDVTTVDEIDPLALVRADTHGVQNLPVEQKEGCRECEWRNWCTGGCPVATFRATGRYDVKSPNCNIYKAIFPEVLRLERLRKQRYQPVPEN